MIIELLDGTRFDIADFSLGVEDYDIPSVEIEHTASDIEGSNNPIITESNFAGRTIPVKFAYLAYDYADYLLLRNELNALFARKEAFYVIFKDEPYKRWLVKTANQFSTQKDLEIAGSMDVSFFCVNTFAETIGTSLDLQNRKDWDVDLWGYGMGIDWDKEYRYEFSTMSFIIENLGNVAVDPRENDLEIVIKATAASYLQIRNMTTGDVWRYNGSLSSNDSIVLKGIFTLKNGVSAFKNTNHKLLTLAVGNNNFVIEGGTIHSIAFNFRFLYL